MELGNMELLPHFASSQGTDRIGNSREVRLCLLDQAATQSRVNGFLLLQLEQR